MIQSHPIEISKNFFLYRSPEKDFHRNIYLKTFVGSKRTVNMIFDPGTILDAGNMFNGFGKIIGNIDKINIIFLSHQDPDVSSNTSTLMKYAPRSILLTSVDTWRLTNMYGLPEKRFYPAEQFSSNIIRIKPTGHVIKVVPARYCHFRGSMMIYDLESKTLFSGDFLGGVNSRSDAGHIATDDSWEGISLFHQLYMPSSKAIQHTINLISSLDPLPEVIAPQHGDVITGELVYKFLGKLSSLKVGIDFIISESIEKEKAILAINKFLVFVYSNYTDEYTTLKRLIDNIKDFSKSVVLKNDKIRDLKVSPHVAFNQIYSVFDDSDLENGTFFKEIFLQNIYDVGLDFIPHDEDRDEFDEIEENINPTSIPSAP
jgi:flavorubredoxin